MLKDDIGSILKNMTEVARLNKQNEIFNVLKNSKFEFDIVYSDGSIDRAPLFNIVLQIPTETFATIENNLGEIESDIKNRLERLVRKYPERIYDVIIEPYGTEAVSLENTNTNEFAYPSEDNPLWGKDTLRLFLSHTSDCKILAKEIQDKLKDFGISVFVAHIDIEPAKLWQNEILKALASMDALCALISNKFHESKWCDQEVGFAFGRKLTVIPIRYENNPYGFLGAYQAITYNDGIHKLCDNIFNALLQNECGSKLVNSFVDKFCNSRSYLSAINGAKLLKNIKGFLNEDQKVRLTNSISTNNQISGANGVEKIIRETIEGI